MLDTENKVKIDSEVFGQKTWVIGTTGSGKSYTARVLIEEGIKLGNAFIVFDPQGAYNNLPNFLYVKAEDVKNVKSLALLLSQTHKNTVINMQGSTVEEKNAFMKLFVTEYKKNIKKGIQTIVIDEAHNFIPEGQQTTSKNVVMSLFQESRSDGLGIIAISQRPARVDKTSLGQGTNYLLGRVTSSQDKKALANYLDDPKTVEQFKKFKDGKFYIMGMGQDDEVIVQIRKAETEHSGSAPKNLLNENAELFNEYAPNIIKGFKPQSQSNDSTKQSTARGKEEKQMDTLDKGKALLPSKDTAWSLAKLGMSFTAGSAVSGLVGTVVASKVMSPIPIVSSRTLASAGTTVVMYAGYKIADKRNFNKVANVMKYGAAGSAAYTVGSAAFDVMNATGLGDRVPSIVKFVMATATGVQPMAQGVTQQGKTAGEQPVDTDATLGN